MKRIENNRRWKIKEKMVKLFRAVGIIGTKGKGRTDHLHKVENPIHNKAYKHVNNPRTLAFVR